MAGASGSDASAGSSGTADTNAVGRAVAQGIGAGKEKEEEKDKVISPELRLLLSRKVIKLNKEAVVESGGGVS